jgi:hypothetical protein
VALIIKPAAVSLAEVRRMRDVVDRLGVTAAAEYLRRAGLRILDGTRGLASGGPRVDIVGPLRSPSGDFGLELVRGLG